MEHIEFPENKDEKTEKFDLEELREEIGAIKDKEMKKKEEWLGRGKVGEAYDPHFDDIKIEYLINDDLNIYKKFKDNTLLPE